MRVVCLSAEAADICFRLGAWDQVAAVSAFARVDGAPKPVVSGFATGWVDRILEPGPDLVITFSDVQANLARDLIKAGGQVLALNHASLQGVVDSIHLLGAVLGVPLAASRLADQFTKRLAALRHEPARRPRVYFEEWDHPLIGGVGWVQELIALAGGEPVICGAENFKAAQRVCSPAAVLERDPEIILLSWCGKPADVPAVRARPGWYRCTAVRENQIFSLDPNKILQASPALVEGLVAIREIIVAWCAGRDQRLPPSHPPTE